MDEDAIEDLLAQLPGSITDIPANASTNDHLRVMLKTLIHTNYLLAALYVSLNKGTRQ